MPQIYVSTGATEWGARDKHADHPYTIGWQPDYQAEGAIYGRYVVANLPNAKIGIIYQNDSYGRDYINGLQAGLGSHKSQIVSQQGFEVTDTSVTNQVLGAARAGVDTLIDLRHADADDPHLRDDGRGRLEAGQHLPELGLGDRHLHEHRGRTRGRGRGERVDQRLLHRGPGEPVLEQRRRHEAVQVDHGQVRPVGAKVTDGLYIYGMAKAYTFVQALKAAGPNPTRAGLLKAVLNMNDKTNPFLLPGVVTKTGPNDYFPISQNQLIKFNNGTWAPMGKVVDTRPRG